MAMKNTAEVVIAGKVYKISGYESPEYLHQIAVYLNDRMTELQNMEGFRKQNTDQRQILLNMNLADDYFKARHEADRLREELEKKERELYSVRHDLIEAQLKLENEKKGREEQEPSVSQKSRRQNQRQQSQRDQSQREQKEQ